MRIAGILPMPASSDPAGGCAPIAGVPTVVRAVAALLDFVSPVDVVAVVAQPHDAIVRAVLASTGVAVTPVSPAAGRREALRVGLRWLSEGRSPIPALVHDHRYPLVPQDVVGRVVAALGEGQSVVVPAAVVTDSVKVVDDDGGIRATVDRGTLLTLQSPRGFAAGVLANLVETDGDDELAAAATLGTSVTTVDGHADAGRFAPSADAALLEAIIATR